MLGAGEAGWLMRARRRRAAWMKPSQAVQWATRDRTWDRPVAALSRQGRTSEPEAACLSPQGAQPDDVCRYSSMCHEAESIGWKGSGQVRYAAIAACRDGNSPDRQRPQPCAAITAALLASGRWSVPTLRPPDREGAGLRRTGGHCAQDRESGSSHGRCPHPGQGGASKRAEGAGCKLPPHSTQDSGPP